MDFKISPCPGINNWIDKHDDSRNSSVGCDGNRYITEKWYKNIDGLLVAAGAEIRGVYLDECGRKQDPTAYTLSSSPHEPVTSWKITQGEYDSLTTYVYQEHSTTDHKSTFGMFFIRPGTAYIMYERTKRNRTISLSVNGFHVSALLDTGSNVSTISFDALKQLGVDNFVDPFGGDAAGR